MGIAALLLIAVFASRSIGEHRTFLPYAATVRGQTPTDTEKYSVDANDLYTPDSFSSVSPTASITDAERTWLLHMREEEKLAHDVYVTLGARWGLHIFNNISTSEQTHTDAVRASLERYSITDPVKDLGVGIFTLPDIQKLYSDLVQKGSLTAVDALTVGATIEDLDIHDLTQALEESKASDIRTTYANLQKGSRNHMRAFVRQLKINGTDYAPQFISAAEYSIILSTPQERGRL